MELCPPPSPLGPSHFRLLPPVQQSAALPLLQRLRRSRSRASPMAGGGPKTSPPARGRPLLDRTSLAAPCACRALVAGPRFAAEVRCRAASGCQYRIRTPVAPVPLTLRKPRFRIARVQRALPRCSPADLTLTLDREHEVPRLARTPRFPQEEAEPVAGTLLEKKAGSLRGTVPAHQAESPRSQAL